MNTPKHQEQSLKILDHLGGWGLPTDILQRMGALGVLWGVFETNLETTLWALNKEVVACKRPSTDSQQISKWIELLAHGSAAMNAEALSVVRTATQTAEDLMQYRHDIVHGWLVPFDSGPMFVRNPPCSGESRKRPSSEAHISEKLLDMAIDAAWSLCSMITALQRMCAYSTGLQELLAMKSDIERAKRQAGELRHLTDLMNHERY